MMGLTFLRLLCFSFSSYGWMVCCKDKLKVEENCTPVIVFSGIGNAVFLAGILNIMNFVFGCIYAVGLFLALRYTLGNKKDRKVLNSGSMIIFGVCVILLFYALIDEKFYQYDNFSHWGIVIKNIYMDSAFPNFEDSFLVTYQSYPLGSASFIWYVCKAIGYSEGCAMFAQCALVLSCVLPLFMFSKNVQRNRKIYIYIYITIVAYIGVSYGSNYANDPFNMLVDKLLAFIAIAAFTMVYWYRKELTKAIACALPLLVFVITVKNSGLVWVVAIVIEIAFFWFKYSRYNWREFRLASLLLAVPMLFWFLWNKHVQLVFSSGATTSHAMSVQNYSSVFAEKTKSDIEKIHTLFLGRVFSVDNKIWILMGVIIALLLLSWFLDNNILKKVNGVFFPIYLLIIYVIYQVGNYVMYLVSMPLAEALDLAGYSRYAFTVEFFIWGAILVVFLSIISQAECKFGLTYLFVMSLGIFLLISKTDDISWIFEHNVPLSGRENSRVRMDEIIEKYKLEEGKKSLVYIGDPQDRDVGYRGYMLKYTLYSKDVVTVRANQLDRLDGFAQLDYLIILERDDTVTEYLHELGLPVDEECIVVANYQ